jgi:iron complex transport system substrate-binding protein
MSKELRGQHMKTKPVLAAYLLVAILVAGLLSGCRGGLFGPSTFKVTDDMGREVTLPRRVQRIVSLAPANTEILFAVGAGAQVVGIDAYSNYPPETAQVAKVGDYLQVSAESVVALNPDVVLASSLHRQLVEQLEQLGKRVLVVEPATFEALYNDIATVGRITGHEQNASQVVQAMRAKLAEIADKLKGLPASGRPVVWYEVWDDPLMSAGPGTYIGQVIELAGGVNVAKEAETDYPIISPEFVVASNPGVIIWPIFEGARELTAGSLSGRPGWAGISAVREGRIYSIDADIISRGGPRLADAAMEMARLLHPDLFK